MGQTRQAWLLWGHHPPPSQGSWGLPRHNWAQQHPLSYLTGINFQFVPSSQSLHKIIHTHAALCISLSILNEKLRVQLCLLTPVEHFCSTSLHFCARTTPCPTRRGCFSEMLITSCQHLPWEMMVVGSPARDSRAGEHWGGGPGAFQGAVLLPLPET